MILYSLRVFRRDVEIYCDDRAIAAVSALAEDNGLTASGRREYARVLIKSAAGQQGFVPVTTSFIGSEKEVTARIKRIAEFKKAAGDICGCFCTGSTAYTCSLHHGSTRKQHAGNGKRTYRYACAG